MHLRMCCIVALLLGAIGTLSADAATRTVISYASFNERTAGALLVAQDQGFFRKQDLDARLVYVGRGMLRSQL